MSTGGVRAAWDRALGKAIERDPPRYRTKTRAIRDLDAKMRGFSDGALQDAAATVTERVRDLGSQRPTSRRPRRVAGANGGSSGVVQTSAATPETLQIEAFSLAREAARRTIGLNAHDEQLVAAFAMHDGRIVQMDTGEGKTLAAVFTVFLRAAAGHGAHVLTFNDYLARRDALWMGPVYRMLGLSVGHVDEGSGPGERRAAYRRDITYLTANECGFDVLRDGLVLSAEARVHREFHFCLVDEADSILIDEARVPLVIAATDSHRGTLPQRLAAIVGKLEADAHFGLDEYERAVDLTERGLSHVEALLGTDLLAAENLGVLSALNCALHANVLLHRDIDYIVRDGAIKLVDEHTGRVAEDRHWPDGLQAALEAKEGLEVRHGGRILGSIPIQHLIRRYPHRCGMTGTATTAATELAEVYGTDVVVVPPHRPCVRDDREDLVFTHADAKWRALRSEIAAESRRGRPILVGTASVGESEQLAATLRDEGIECAVLNAKNDAQEATVVAEAGAPGAVTISTNMAGRGTDIRLGGQDGSRRNEVVESGGLYVIGTNRHESRRIDDQLRGRAGRQGDPGASRFFVSLEDPLIARFGVRSLIPERFMPSPGPAPIDHPVVLTEIARAQRIIEGQNAEIRKTLSRYSSHIDAQRAIVEQERDKVLSTSVAADVLGEIDAERLQRITTRIGATPATELCRRLMLLEIDSAWSDHLADVADLREGIHLHRVGRQDPLFEFQKATGLMFREFQDQVKKASSARFLAIDADTIDLDADDLKGPSATWTYLINDDPFADQLAKSLAGNVGFAMGAAYLWPLLFLWAALTRLRTKRDSAQTNRPSQ